MRRLTIGCCLCLAIPLLGEVRPVVVTGAPFPLTISEWTPPARDFPITAYGAKPDGTPVTEAIDRAIAAAAAAGGGRVCVPAGTWTTGAISLTNNVALVLDDRATLYFPDDPEIVMRAPVEADGRAKLTHRALVGAVGCTNVAVMGRGTFRAKTDYWHRGHCLNPQRGFRRPQFFRFAHCGHVRLEGFKVRGSPAWTLVFEVSSDIILRDIDSSATGPNTDGLDLVSCNRALVERCSLDQTDDGFTIKSGLNAAGRRRNIPCQNIVLRDCTVIHTGSLLGVGSEVSGGIRNIYVENCTVREEVLRVLSLKTNSKRGAFMENIAMRHIRAKKAGAVFGIRMFYDGNPVKELPNKGKLWLTRISDISLDDVVCAEAQYAVHIDGDELLPPKNIRVANVRIGRVKEKLVTVKNCPGAVISNVVQDDACRDPDLPDVRTAPEPPWIFCERSRTAVNRQLLDHRIQEETRTNKPVSAFPAQLGGTKHQGELLDKAGLLTFYRQLMAERGYGRVDENPPVWVGRVSEKTGVCDQMPGIAVKVVPDRLGENVCVRIENASGLELRDVVARLHLPVGPITRLQVFHAAAVAAGKDFSPNAFVGAGDRKFVSGRPFYAVEVDFTREGRRGRLWATAEGVAPRTPPTICQTARTLGLVDVADLDLARLQQISAETNALVGPSARHVWRGTRFADGEWFAVSPATHAYTPAERALVAAGRARKVSVLQFEAPAFAKPQLRSNAYCWDPDVVYFFNGERLQPRKKQFPLLNHRPGVNRLVVVTKPAAGDLDECLQAAVYTWGMGYPLPGVDTGPSSSSSDP